MSTASSRGTTIKLVNPKLQLGPTQQADQASLGGNRTPRVAAERGAFRGDTSRRSWLDRDVSPPHRAAHSPIAAAVVIFTLIGAWNDSLMPLVFLQSQRMQTITLIPTFFVGEFNNDQTKILASAVVTAIPEVVAYLGLQRLFERWLSAGAIT
ncbi:MAG: hypothetical protein M0014_00460 [Actinomycetota bacterium]|nr:hypothetical protein [Actinomycetota bacterium]